MITEKTKNSNLINTAEMKQYLSNILIEEEYTENTISEELGISEKEVLEFLKKCYEEASFQYKSNEILVHLANNYLPLDEKEINAEVVSKHLRDLMRYESDNEY